MDALRHKPSRPGAALPALSPWRDIDDESREMLLDGALSVDVDRDVYLDASVAVVTRGVLALERQLSDGRRMLVALFHDGDFVDLRQSERARQCRIVTVAPSEVLVFEETWIDACRSRCPAIGTIIDRQVQRHRARSYDHIADLAAKTPLERVASVFFEFRRWPDGDDSQDHGQPVIRIPIRRADIADYLGITPETLSRAVRCLEQDGLIRAKAADRIRIIDVVGMRQIANGGRPRRSTKKG